MLACALLDLSICINTLKVNMVTIKKLLIIDTDSLMCEIKTEDTYEDSSEDKEMFDFSNYSADLKYYNAPKQISCW